ncbi:SRPBCC family protein [Massilia endophytica]|uniref:SRPBCC family protein n=1 Tax=Massilia endophytica TaxID=2899220 RepID=UPI001E61A1CF|nr:SRPBCC family protein [Massilia endophytica]UGQ48333.1 SRPBCC family protein [Massilia endophytica]
MIGSSTVHSSFAIERNFRVPPSKVFASWASVEAKKVWFSCDDAMVTQEFSLDFRPGGRETNRVAVPGGEVHMFQGVYLDIVPDRRIIYAYDMHVGEKRISASLATVVFEPQGSGTKMVFTEQIAFLDGYSDREERIRGTEIGLDKLVLSLEPMDGPAQ